MNIDLNKYDIELLKDSAYSKNWDLLEDVLIVRYNTNTLKFGDNEEYRELGHIYIDCIEEGQIKLYVCDVDRVNFIKK